jgi:hypothetical protein
MESTHDKLVLKATSRQHAGFDQEPLLNETDCAFEVAKCAAQQGKGEELRLKQLMLSYPDIRLSGDLERGLPEFLAQWQELFNVRSRHLRS